MAIEINELKQMLKHSTAVLILDNGDPSFVVLDYATYRKILDQGEQAPAYNGLIPPTPNLKGQSGETELLERINKDILALKEQIEEEERSLGIDDSR